MEDLELLRMIFADDRLHIGIGTIKQLGLATDGSKLRAQIMMLPDEREVVAEVGFMDVYCVSLPEIDDLVLVAFVDGHPDEAFVIKILSHKEEPIPEKARAGHLVLQPRDGKKAYLTSSAKINIAKPGVDPTEPLVLGTVLVNFMTAIFNALLNAPQIGQCAVGPVWLDGQVRADLVAAKQTYITDASTNIVSQLGFTERGT